MIKGMIKVTIFYPRGDGNSFDMDYYTRHHVALIKERIGDALKGCSVDSGVGVNLKGTGGPYLAMTSLYFESVDDFRDYFGPHIPEFLEDLPNFTTCEPMIQVSEVME